MGMGMGMGMGMEISGAVSTRRGEIEVLTKLLSRLGTPFICGHDQKDAVEVLLEHNANPNAEAEDDITLLLSAVAEGSLACVELLVKAGAKANVFAGGATPLHIAADIGNLELINCLLNAVADSNHKDEEQEETGIKKDVPEATVGPCNIQKTIALVTSGAKQMDKVRFGVVSANTYSIVLHSELALLRFCA
ncbi:ankyrin-1-like [Capsella rubella]|uniref:ankyrin-1-like n=1 Tax=Capsella rubella TaxID=81985 RepID=UPI000CD4A75E|nr:ankyrin-1-like [Capsella rubella]